MDIFRSLTTLSPFPTNLGGNALLAKADQGARVKAAILDERK
jgi:hypothetical protein